MPKTNDEIFGEIKELKSWLYGENGYEGDIPEIKKDLKSHQKRIARIELIITGLLGTGLLTGGTVGLAKLIGG